MNIVLCFPGLKRLRMLWTLVQTVTENFLIVRNYHKIPKHLNTRKIAVIILKLEQYQFATESLVQTMLKKWQTV